MRVLILGLGGISRHFRNWPERTLGHALVRAGHQVHALTYWQPASPQLGLEQREETIDGIHVYRVRPQFFPARDLLAALTALPRPDVAPGWLSSWASPESDSKIEITNTHR